MKRPLNEEERKICETSYARLDEELRYANFAVEHAKLMLNMGLELNYIRQRKEFESKLKAAEDTAQASMETMNTLVNQLNDGVEQKEPITIVPSDEEEMSYQTG